MPKERSRIRMLLFQKKKILELRWGFPPYNFDRPMVKRCKLKEISLAVGVKLKTISKFLNQYKKDGLLERKNFKRGHRKVSVAVIIYLTSQKTLQAQRHMTMD